MIYKALRIGDNIAESSVEEGVVIDLCVYRFVRVSFLNADVDLSECMSMSR